MNSAYPVSAFGYLKESNAKESNAVGSDLIHRKDPWEKHNEYSAREFSLDFTPVAGCDAAGKFFCVAPMRYTARMANGLAAVLLCVAGAQPAAATVLFGTANAGGSNNRLVSIDLATDTVSTVLATGIKQPDGLLFDSSGRIIYTVLQGEVRRFDPSTSTDELLVSGLSTPVDIVLEPGGNTVLVSEFSGGRIVRIDLTTKTKTTLLTPGGNPEGLAFDASGRLFANLGSRNGGTTAKHVSQINPVTGAILASSSGLDSLDGLTFDPVTGLLYSASLFGDLIYALDPGDLTMVSTVASGVPMPDGVVSDGLGNLFIAARDDSHVYQFDLSASTLTQRTLVTGIDDLAPATGLGSKGNAVPEPATAILGLAGFGVLVIMRRRVA